MSKYYKSLILSILIITITLLVVYVLDRVVGNKFNKIYAGWNKEGYRGEIKKNKKKNSYRIIAVGGSTTFGYGTKYDQSWPFLLEKKFLSDEKDVDVVNLGGLSHGMWAIHKDIIHYDYLDYDCVIIFNGYNDINPDHLAKFSKRHNNLIFKLFGYLPTLDVYLYEKIALMIYGDLAKFYSSKRTEGKDETFYFDNNKKILTEDENKKLQKKLEAKLKLNKPYEDYINEYSKVLNYLIKNRKRIIVIHQPNLSSLVLDLQKLNVDNLLSKYEEILVLNFRNLIDLQDKNLSMDGMHLTHEGNNIIAEEIYKNIKNTL